MVKIRLRRVGARKQPSYRIVIADSRAPRDGRFIEAIGFYNPRTEPETVKYEEERALYWLGVGAQPTESVARLFTTYGTMDRFARLKAGEPLDVLLAEAEAVVEDQPTPEEQPEEVVEEEPAEEEPVEEEPVEEEPVEEEPVEEEPAEEEPAEESEAEGRVAEEDESATEKGEEDTEA